MTHNPNTPISPRLKALQDAFAAGYSSALNEFWAEIEIDGTPLFEPIEDDDEHIYATFLWRGDDDLENVLTFSAIVGYDVETKKNHLSKLGDTNVWFRTEKIRRDLLTTYQFSPNDSLAPINSPTDFAARIANSQIDPLNPNVFVYPKDEEDPDSKALQVSILRSPFAKSQPYVNPRPDVPCGSLEKHTLSSKILDNARRIWIYTPPDYDPERRPYPLLLLFDGHAYIHTIPTPTILDNLIAERAIPPMVAIFVDNAKGQRGIELSCNPKFAQFIGDELTPWLRERVEVIYDPHQTVIAGSSSGATAAAYVALWYPNLFGNILSQSGSYWWYPENDEPGWLIREYLRRERTDLRFYMDVGLLEKMDFRKMGFSQLGINRHMRDVLTAKGYPLTYVEYSGGHDYIWWRQTLADGLIALMSKSR